MKILKYIFFALVGLILIFFLIGLIKPATKYGHTITVNKPIEEAWAVSKDETKFAQWLEGFKSIELISGERDAVGSKAKVIVNPGEGQDDFEMIQTLIAIKEFDHVEMHFDSDMMDFEQIISFKENADKTIVATDSKVIGKNLMLRSMFAIMEMFGGFTKQETENMENLRKIINENTTDYYPATDTNG